MTAGARRVASLAAVAVLAVAIALYVSHRGGHSALPAGAGAVAHGARRRVLAACPDGLRRHGRADTVGVGHPVLPCGVELYLRYGDRTVLTRVIDRGHVGPSRGLNLTPALAALLGVTGTQPLEWRFVR